MGKSIQRHSKTSPKQSRNNCKAKPHLAVRRGFFDHSSSSKMNSSSMGVSNTREICMASFSDGLYFPFSKKTIVSRRTRARSASSCWVSSFSWRYFLMLVLIFDPCELQYHCVDEEYNRHDANADANLRHWFWCQIAQWPRKPQHRQPGVKGNVEAPCRRHLQ